MTNYFLTVSTMTRADPGAEILAMSLLQSSQLSKSKSVGMMATPPAPSWNLSPLIAPTPTPENSNPGPRWPSRSPRSKRRARAVLDFSQNLTPSPRRNPRPGPSRPPGGSASRGLQDNPVPARVQDATVSEEAGPSMLRRIDRIRSEASGWPHQLAVGWEDDPPNPPPEPVPLDD